MRRAGVALLLLSTVAAGSCTGGSGDSGAPLPSGAPEIEVSMREYAFDHTKEIPAGRVIFRVRNDGDVPHRLSVFPLPEDLPPIDVQLRGTERRVISPFAGIYDRASGEEGTFAVDLVPGQRYAFVCFVVDEGGSHATKGMSSEFRAGGASPPTTKAAS